MTPKAEGDMTGFTSADAEVNGSGGGGESGSRKKLFIVQNLCVRIHYTRDFKPF